MKISLDDPYWSRLIATRFNYEPDLLAVVEKLRGIDFHVIDCGANLGYWSILLSAEFLGSRHVLAVEASRSTFNGLAENCVLNKGRFTCLHHALSASSGQTVWIDSSNGHPAARVHMASTPVPTTAEAVTTITIDDLARAAYGVLPDRVLLKLDVEGQEIASLLGAHELLQRDVLLYYEDHGNDPSSTVTDYVLRTCRFKVFYRDHDGRMIEINSAKQASARKRQRSQGYNFFACRSNSQFLSTFAGASS